MQNSTPIIECHDLSFRYKEAPILENITFSIWAGECVSIIGPNGSGKTTLARILLGILRPNSGYVRLFGTLPQAGNIGYVPQHHQVDPSLSLTAIEVVSMGRLKARRFFFTRKDRTIAMEALEMVQLSERARDPFVALSIGQRQRVLIARALAAQSPILVLDEPTSAIDAPAEDNLIKLIVSLTQKTIILITHDMSLVNAATTRVLCLNKTAEMHPIEKLSEETLRKFYWNNSMLVHHRHHFSE